MIFLFFSSLALNCSARRNTCIPRFIRTTVIIIIIIIIIIIAPRYYTDSVRLFTFLRRVESIVQNSLNYLLHPITRKGTQKDSKP